MFWYKRTTGGWIFSIVHCLNKKWQTLLQHETDIAGR